MRISVVATSNAIMTKGWVNLSAGTASERDAAYENLSIGGSSSLYGAFMAETADLGDQIVFDFLLNDQMLVNLGALTVEQSIGQHLVLIRALVARGLADRAMVVLLPLQQTMAENLFSDLFTAIITALREAGIRFIDARQAILGWVQGRGEDLSAAYVDDRHLSPPYQELLGNEVLRVLAQPPATGAARSLYQALPPADFARLTVPAADFETRTVGTGLRRAQVTLIPDGAQFPVSGCAYLLAGLIWIDDHNGTLLFEAGGRRYRHLARRGFKNIFLFDTFNPPLQMEQGAHATATNDRSAPYWKVIGMPSSIYNSTGSITHLGALIGCNILPSSFIGLLEQQRAIAAVAG